MATNDEKKQRGTLVNILDLEDAVGAKGIAFDPEVEYTFTITKREARRLESEKDGHKKEFTVIEIFCTEQESQATIKQSFFHNNKVTVNEEDLAKESDVVKFARGTGHQVGVDKKFSFNNVLREGTQFKAHVKPQIGKDGKTPTGYSEIDLMSIKPGKAGSSQKAQTKISGSSEDEQFLIDMSAGYSDKTSMITGLSKIGKTSLINLLISLDDNGKLKYQK